MKFKKKSTWAAALTFILIFLLTGCAAIPGAVNTTAPSDSTATGDISEVDSADSLQQNEEPSLAASPPNSTTTKSSGNSTSTAGNTIDYNQYLKKTWIRNTDTDFPNGGLSILISDIEDGKIQGKLSAVGDGPAYDMDSAEFEGTVNHDTAECRLANDSGENKGTIKFLFKSDSTLEATIIITGKSGDTVRSLPEGTFELSPYNLKNIEGFSLNEDQTFMVDLNSWGNVKFVSGKLTAGNHIPVVFYLTNEDGDILYDFGATLPYSVDVTAVSFKDVNEDGLKDIIIIVADNYNGSSGEPIAAVYMQNADGSFTDDYKLDQEINDSGNNKDIDTITNYLSGKNISQNKNEVIGKVKLYDGVYFDDRCFGENFLKNYCEVEISNITDTSFDFTVYEVNESAGEKNKKVVFPANTAVFTGDGTKAAFYGNEYTLDFTFPNYHNAEPIVTDIEISGFQPLKGNTYVNNGIPGHEFG